MTQHTTPKFSKVFVTVDLLGNISLELTFENLCSIWRDLKSKLSVDATHHFKILKRLWRFTPWHYILCFIRVMSKEPCLPVKRAVCSIKRALYSINM